MMYEFKTKSPNNYFADIEDVTPQEVLEAKEHLHIVDVREVSEFNGELGHAPSSELIVLSTLPQQLEKLSKSKTVVFVCRSGGRSSQAAAFAKQNGFINSYNMIGGMLLWNQLQLPTEKQ